MKALFSRAPVLATVLLLGIWGNVHAAPYTTLDGAASGVSFGYSQMNVKMGGSFGELRATEFHFDPAQPEAAKVSIEIKMSSVDAGYAEANTELAKDDWLAWRAHPIATFSSNRVDVLDANSYQVTGSLTIKGVTKEVSAPFTFKEDGDTGVFEGSFSFQRADFGIGEGQWKDFGIVANVITVTFKIVAKS
jgi:Uncharacterized conserved protein